MFTTREEIIEEERKKRKEDKKGPIIICVDTSGSMHGTPEHVAKIMTFALVKIALRDNRKCFLISFSTSIESIELTNLQSSLSDLISFLSMSFHGGTDATPALRKSLEMLESEHYKKADVLVISDFIMGTPDQNVLNSIDSVKESKTKFHSLVISSNANPKVLDFFDSSWGYDLRSEDSIRELVKLKKTL